MVEAKSGLGSVLFDNHTYSHKQTNTALIAMQCQLLYILVLIVAIYASDYDYQLDEDEDSLACEKESDVACNLINRLIKGTSHKSIGMQLLDTVEKKELLCARSVENQRKEFSKKIGIVREALRVMNDTVNTLTVREKKLELAIKSKQEQAVELRNKLNNLNTAANKQNAQVLAEKRSLEVELAIARGRILELETELDKVKRQKKNIEKRLSEQNLAQNKENAQLLAEKSRLEAEIRKKTEMKPIPKGSLSLASGKYFLNPTRLTWSDARQYCTSQGRDLVSIESEEENGLLASQMRAVGASYGGHLAQYGGFAIWTSGCYSHAQGGWDYDYAADSTEDSLACEDESEIVLINGTPHKSIGMQLLETVERKELACARSVENQRKEFSKKIGIVREALRVMNDTVNTLTIREKKLELAIKSKQEQAVELRNKLNNLNTAANEQNAQVLAEKRRLEAELAIARGRILELETELDKVKRQKKNIENELNDQNSSQNEKNSQLLAEKNKLEGDLAAARAKILKIESDLDAEKKEKDNIKEEVKKLSEENRSLVAANNVLMISSNKTTKECALQAKTITDLESKVETIKQQQSEERDTCNTKLNKLEDDAKKCEVQNANVNSNLEQCKNDENTLKTQLQSLTNEVKETNIALDTAKLECKTNQEKCVEKETTVNENVNKIQLEVKNCKADKQQLESDKGKVEAKLITTNEELEKCLTATSTTKFFTTTGLPLPKDAVRLSTGIYIFNQNRMSWDNARKFCKSRSMDLLSIESAEENEVITKQMRTYGHEDNAKENVLVDCYSISKLDKWMLQRCNTELALEKYGFKIFLRKLGRKSRKRD
ncbi:hypothetical protein B566_EDAN002145 [Ephemera danica]|nr:hypothetical protein B566_EDAN002145 [Ephemera danica]